ncbi:MAG: hypothetical protein FWD26_03085 [Treponema sp.]|nr:hypothetical protein [Treponema sp.]
MNKKLPVFSKRCFWEQDSSKLDLDKSKRYIITKVLSFGSQDDHIELFNYYGWDIIKEEVIQIKYLNKKIMNFLSVLFEINIKSFKAYNNRGLF